MPGIMVDRVIEGLRADKERIDNFKGAYDITKYLIELGHRRGYIDRKVAQSHSLEQRRGFEKPKLCPALPRGTRRSQGFHADTDHDAG